MKRKLFLTVLLSVLVLATTAIFTSCAELNLSNEKEIVSIEITDLPDTIVIGTFDEIGGRLKINYTDGANESVPFKSIMLSEKYRTMLEKVGSYTIEVLYRGKSATFEISVRELFTYVLTIKNAQGLTIHTQTFTEGEEQTINYPTAEEMFVDGYRFTGFAALELPITEDTTVYGEYVKTWKVSFYNAVNGLISRQIIDDGKDATAPAEEEYAVDGYEFIAWDHSFKAVHADTLVYGIYSSVTENEEPTATDASYFTFTELDDGNYEIKAKDVTVMPAEVSLPSTHNGKTVTSIGDFAFSGCSGLTSVTIPDSVTSIGEWAFGDCSGLTSITIGNSVTSISDYAFLGCSGLTSVIVDSNNKRYRSENNCLIEKDSNVLLLGCNNSAIPTGVTSIGDSAFNNCSGLTSVTIPDSVTSIGYCAFFNCSGLTSVTIPDSVTSIGNSAFDECSGLTSVTIPDSVTSIGEWAFSWCRGLTSVTIGSSVTSIGHHAFYGCSGLKGVYYKGSSVDWENIAVGSENTDLTNAKRYYYSEEEPTETGNYWHYDENGEISIW